MHMAILRLTHTTVDLQREIVVDRAGVEVSLTSREAALLRYLSARPGESVSRDELLTEVWGYSGAVNSRATDNHMRRLRKKIEADASRPDHLITVFGHGYRFVPLAEATPRPAEPRSELPAPESQGISLGHCTVDLARQMVFHEHQTFELTTIEVASLTFLLARAGRTVTQRELLRHVWKRDANQPTRAVAKAMNRLRNKIERDPTQPQVLITMRGRGYQLRPAVDDTPEMPLPLPDAALVLCRIDGLELLFQAHADVANQLLNRVASCLGTVAPSAHSIGGTGRLGYAFHTVDAALSWCGTAQKDLLQQAWSESVLARPEGAERFDPQGRLLYRGPRVAMAVHWGRATTLEGPDGRHQYAGGIAARVQQMVGHVPGGLLWVSAAAWHHASRGVRAAHHARNLGTVGPGGALWAVVPLELQGRQLPSSRARTALGLSSASTSFVGRASELETMASWQRGESLRLTLVGPGGVGKTRLAHQFSSRAGSDVWWCELAAAQDSEQALARIAHLLGLPDAKPARIARVLKLRPAIVVLDNVEQMEDFAETFVDLMDRSGRTRWIVTSRRTVQVGGDVLELGPLTPQAARMLFEDRTLVSDVQQHSEVVDELVERLDNLPLAIELAAGRTRLFTASDLLRRLPERLALLATKGTGRHATMRAAISWSWDLAEESERAALARLSVFRGSFTIPDAEAVFGNSTSLDVIEALQAQSLLVVRDTTAGRRFSLLRSIREFAAEQLSADGASEVNAHYMRRMASLGQTDALRATYEAGATTRILGLIEAIPDLIGAAEMALRSGNGPCAARCCRALKRGVHLSSKQYRMVRDLADRALTIPELDPVVHGHLLGVSAGCSSSLRHMEEAERVATNALSASDDPEVTMLLHGILATVNNALARYDVGLEHQLSALTLARRLAATPMVGVYLGNLSKAYFHRGDHAAAIARCREGIETLSAVGNDWELSNLRYFLARLLHHDGRLRQAQALYLSSLSAKEAIDDASGIAEAHQSLSLLLHESGELDSARRHIRQSIQIRLDLGQPELAAAGLSILCCLEFRLGDVEAGQNSAARAASLAIRYPRNRAEVHANLAEAALEAERPDDALEHVAVAASIPMAKWFEAPLLRVKAEALLLADDPGAPAMIEQAISDLRGSAGSGVELVKALCLRGRWACRNGHEQIGMQAYDEAVTLAGPRGRNPHTERGRALGKLKALIASTSAL